MDVVIETNTQTEFQLGSFKMPALHGSEEQESVIKTPKDLKTLQKDQLFRLVKIYLESNGQKGIRSSDESFSSKIAIALEDLMDNGLVCINPNAKDITEFFPTIKAFQLLNTDLFTFDRREGKFPAYIITKDQSAVILPSEELVKSFFEFVKDRHLEEPLKIQKWADYLEINLSCLLGFLKASPHFKFLITNNFIAVGTDTLTAKAHAIPSLLDESFKASLEADPHSFNEEVMPVAKRQVRDLSGQILETKGKIIKLFGKSDSSFTTDILRRQAISQGIILPANTIVQVALQGLVAEGKLLSLKNGVFQPTANQVPESSVSIDQHKMPKVVTSLLRVVNNYLNNYRRSSKSTSVKLESCAQPLELEYQTILEALRYYKNQEFINLVKDRKVILTPDEAKYLKIDLGKL